MRVLIAGGGIGGLATAVALKGIGMECRVLERAPEIRELGAALSLWANAVRALQELGVAEAVTLAGSRVSKAVTVTAHGKKVSEMDLTPVHQAAGAASLCVHRADLQRVLAQALPDGWVLTGAECTGYEAHGGTVEALLTNGRKESGDILIGADGIHSAIRTQLLGGAKPRYAGYVALRGMAPIPCPLPDEELLFVQGRGLQLGVLPCGKRTYWFATRNALIGTRWSKQEFMAQLQGWPAEVQSVITATPERDIIQGDVIDRPPSAKWGEGRITLLGDAIHPTTPNLGQGACQAIESAVTLAHCLRDVKPVEKGLRDYEQRRRGRTAMVTTQSWRLGRMLQWENPVLAWIRDQLSASSAGQQQGMKMFHELLAGAKL